MFPLSH